MKLGSFIFITLLLIIFIFFVGCSKNVANDSLSDNRITNASTTTTDYIVKTIPLPDDFIAHRAQFTDDRIILSNSTRVLELDYNGNEINRTILTVRERFDNVKLADDGGYWAIAAVYDDNRRLKNFNIVRFSDEGTELERIIADGSQFGQNEPRVAPNQFMVDGDHIYIMSFHATYMVDKLGQLVMEINAVGNTPKGDITAMFTSLFTLADKRIALSSFIQHNQTGTQSMVLLIPDVDKLEIEEVNILSICGDMNTFFITSQSGETFIGTKTEIQKFDLKTLELYFVIDCLRYNIDVARMAGVAVLSDGCIAIAERAGGEKIEHLTVFIPGNASEEITARYGMLEEETTYVEEKEKQIITLSTLFFDSIISHFVLEFNRTNKHYMIEVWDYSNGTRNFDIGEALTRFHTDIIAGRIADINAVFWWIDGRPFGGTSSIYINQGMYADLNEFMANDPDFDKADYIPGMFEAMEVGGKIYELFPIFWDSILIGKKADLGTEIGWSLDEFAAFLESNPDSQYIIGGQGKREFILRMLQNEFINPHTGEAHFDRDEFKKILAVAERFPNESVDSSYVFSEGAKDGNPLLLGGSLGAMFSTVHVELESLDDEAAVKGWPSSRGNGLFFEPWMYFGITTKAKNPDGAWEFIKFALDYYDWKENARVLAPFVPVKLSLLDEKIELEKADFSNRVFGSRSFNDPGILHSNVIEREYFEQKIDEGATIIKNEIKMVRRNNDVIVNIILEEIDSYLGGQKSADVVLDIIENRLGIYFAEQQ